MLLFYVDITVITCYLLIQIKIYELGGLKCINIEFWCRTFRCVPNFPFYL
jgi:hypothetical protein